MPAELLRTFHTLFNALYARRPECILPSLRADRDQAATSERYAVKEKWSARENERRATEITGSPVAESGLKQAPHAAVL